MRFTPALTMLLAATAFVAAQPAPSDPPPADAEPPPPPPALPEAPAQAPPPAAPPTTVSPPPGPAGSLPPIVINITNNNNGNNSNTNNQTNTAPVTVSTRRSVTVSTPVSVAPGAVAPVSVPLAPAVPRAVIERVVLHPHSQRWIMLGVTAPPKGHAAGTRASIDLLAHGAFALGIDGEVDGLALDGHGRGGPGGRDRGPGGNAGTGTVGAYIAWTGRLGPLDLRAQAGVAVGGNESRGHLGMRGGEPPNARTTTGTGTGMAPISPDRDHDGSGRRLDGQVHGEAALLVGLPLTRHLGVVAGPVLSSEGHAVDVTGFGGVRYRF